MAVVPIYNVLAVPDAAVYMRADYYEQMTGRKPLPGEKLVLVVQKENYSREELTDESFYPIGVSGVLMEVNEGEFLTIRTDKRVDLKEITVYKDHTISLSITRRADIEDQDPKDADERLKAIKSAAVRYSEGLQWGPMARGFIARWSSIGEAAGVMSPWMMNSPREKYEILTIDSLKERNERLEKMIFENLEVSRIGSEAESAQEEDQRKLYRESALRKQIDYLQKELDDMHPETVSDLRRLEMKVASSEMNDEARAEAEKVLNRLKQEGQNGAESGMLYDYLDFLTGLSWKKEEAVEIDLGEAEKVLDRDHYGLKKVKERILQQIAVMNLKKQQGGSILLFVGAPGTGKTSIGQSIAEAMHRKYVRVSLGGVRDEADIRGHRRTYIGAMPGRIMNGIKKSGVSNPVMVLDEVDKLSVSYNGDPASALLEVLDPEQNASFTDHYMNVPYDLSDVLFICTANTTDTIPEPLLNRMEVIPFNGYTAIEKFSIAKEHLIPKAMKAVGISPENLEIPDSVIRTIISDYTREGGVRGLKKRMDTLCRTAAVRLVKGDGERVTVTEESLRDFLDMTPLRHGKVDESARPGIVTGLAWTSAGGEILFIETMFTRGSGQITVTGRLGDVMKESAQIAVSLVKSLFPDRAECFEKNDLHIHVPDGATPKDGPSAGITLTTALASLVTGHSVRPDAAMTGEVSLRGSIGPIGGLPEKLMAAQRAGVKTVFIPEDNMDDLRDVADEVKDALEIVPVKEVTDVLGRLGIVPEAGAEARPGIAPEAGAEA